MADKAFLILAVYLLFPSTALGYGPSAADGGLPGESLSYFSVSPRTMAMGGASVAGAQGVYGSFYNPSLMAGSGKHRMGAMFSPLLGGGSYSAISYSYPLSLSNALGLSLVSHNSAFAVKRSVWGEYQGEFDEKKTILLMSGSHRAGGNTRVGGSFKVVMQDMDGYSGTGMGLDCGIDFSPGENFQVGAFVQNIIPPSIKLKKEKDVFPLNFKLGTEARLKEEKLKVAFDLGVWDPLNQGTLRWALGGEYNIMGSLYLRSGINYKNISAGAGIETETFAFSYTARYSDTGLMHAVGTAYMFSILPSARELELNRRERLLKEKEEAFQEWKSQREDMFARELQQTYSKLEEEMEKVKNQNEQLENLIEAAKKVKRGDYESAEKKLNEILRASPDNGDATALLSIVEEELKRDFSFGRMMRFYSEGHYEKAVSEARKAPSSHPQHEKIMAVYGLSLARLKILDEEFEEAIAYLQKILEDDPQNSAALSLLRRARRLREISR
ncbi:MAG: hypothetical protein ACQESB_04955 [Elusimicrobiota bacterium]